MPFRQFSGSPIITQKSLASCTFTVRAMESFTRRRRKTKVELSPFRTEIETRLRIQTPREVADWLKGIGQPISERSLRSYRRFVLGPREVLSRGSLYRRYSEALDAEFDALKELYNLVAVQIKRVDFGLKLEQETGGLRGVVSQALQLLKDTLVSTIDIEISLGTRKKASVNEGTITDKDFEQMLDRLANHGKEESGSEERTDTAER